MKFSVELSLDGYDDEEEEEAACIEFIQESLEFSASGVGEVKRIDGHILRAFPPNGEVTKVVRQKRGEIEDWGMCPNHTGNETVTCGSCGYGK